jgi:hypothetical protein
VEQNPSRSWLGAGPSCLVGEMRQMEKLGRRWPLSSEATVVLLGCRMHCVTDQSQKVEL